MRVPLVEPSESSSIQGLQRISCILRRERPAVQSANPLFDQKVLQLAWNA